MKFLELITKRQSVRKYINKPIEKEKLIRCIEAARLAQSASNTQPWKFIVIDDPELKDKVAAETYDLIASFNKFVHQAPIIIAITLEKPSLINRIGGRIKKKEWKLIDIGIAAEHICLQATEEGLGSCMLGWYNEKKVKSLLNIPEKKSLALLISIGYFADDYKQREKIRKPMNEVCSFNTY
jgi:nitroreductase